MHKFNNPRIKEPILGEWTLDEFVGKGKYGEVYRAHSKSGRHAAIKIISLPTDDVKSEFESFMGGDEDDLASFVADIAAKFEAEIQSLKQLGKKGNANVIAYYDHVALQDGYFWDIIIVMEFATPLKDYLAETQLTLGRILDVGIDISNALCECEKNNIIHRDIKEDNLFIGNDNKFKIGDFGVANVEGGSHGRTQGIGTYYYMAPEVLRSQSYNNAADIYSLGIVLYKLLNYNRLPLTETVAQKPRLSQLDNEKAYKQRMNNVPIPLPSYGPELVGNIVVKCLAYNVADRYKTAFELRQELLNAKNTLGMDQLGSLIEFPVKAPKNLSPPQPRPQQQEERRQPPVYNVPTQPPEDRGGGYYVPPNHGGYEPGTATQGTTRGGSTTIGMNNLFPQDEDNDPFQKTVDIIKQMIDQFGANSKFVQKFMEKNKAIEGERQRNAALSRSNKKRLVTSVCIACFAVLACVFVFILAPRTYSYYSDNGDEGRIYRHSFLFGKERLNNVWSDYVTVDGNWIYFSNKEEAHSMYRMTIDGRKTELLSTDQCEYVRVIGDYVYYTNYDDEEKLYRINKHDGSEKAIVVDSPCRDLRKDGKYILAFRLLSDLDNELNIDTREIDVTTLKKAEDSD